MSRFRLFPQLLIILALLTCQQFAVAHAISHTYAQTNGVSQDGPPSDEAHCDTCHVVGGLQMFVVGHTHAVLLQQYAQTICNHLLSQSLDLPCSINFQSRAPPSDHA